MQIGSHTIDRRVCACLLAIACMTLPGAALAKEPVAEFLRAAQQQGYGEVALDYLEQLRASGRLPSSLKETWDLELSRSYRAAVAEAFNAAEAETRAAKAQEHLEKFLKEHPDHPEVAGAMEAWGDLALDRALERLRAARVLKDAALAEKHRAAARADLEEARPRFVDATTRYGQRFDKLRGTATKGPRRASATQSRVQRDAERALADAEMAWLDCRFKAAKVDFYLGESYPDRKDPKRKAAFEGAAKAFDDVFQSYRESLVGLHAHLWHGRSVDELGNDQLALDIYDEVLVTAPEGRERETGLEPLFAAAQYHRLLVVKRMQGFQPFLEQAEEWLKLRQAWRRLDAYQGVALEVAKGNLEHAAELPPATRRAARQSALAALAEIARTRGEHQQEAILLRRQHAQSGGEDLSTVKTFDEGFALGESAAENLDWPSAAAAFEKALELRSTTADADRVAQAQARLDQARYQVAAAHYSAGRFAESLAAARALMDQRADGAVAPQAASLAISSALSLYAAAADKPTALTELAAIAKTTIDRWPDRAEADDARIALGQASLVQGDAAKALEVFENVNPRSLRYPAAMHLAGQTHWRLYLGQKRAGHDAAQLEAERTKAQQQLQTSLDGQRKAAGDEPLSRQLAETQLLLGEVLAEGGKTQEAAAHLDPLVEWIRTTKPEPLDNMLLRVFLADARAQLALAQPAKAAAAVDLLFERGPDSAAVNGVLVSLVKLLDDHRRAAEAEVIEAQTAGDGERRAAALKAAEERKKIVLPTVAKLAARQELSLAARVFLADTSAALGQTDAARDLYQAILAQGDADAEFAKTNAAALTRIRTQLVGLIRDKAQSPAEFELGLKQVDELIAAYPNALEPKMEKGRLLQKWADVDAARLDDAVAHWTMLRTRLAKARAKPPEYYEVIYNAADCLLLDGLKSQDSQKALQAEQLLNATLVLSPKLSGPEIVAQYKDLLARARKLRGTSASVRK
jgi:hypothetical protein